MSMLAKVDLACVALVRGIARIRPRGPGCEVSIDGLPRPREGQGTVSVNRGQKTSREERLEHRDDDEVYPNRDRFGYGYGMVMVLNSAYIPDLATSGRDRVFPYTQ